MDLPSVETLIVLALITAAAYAVYGLTGFGNVVIAMPLMLIFLPLHIAAPIAMLHGLFAGSTVGIAERRHANLRELGYLLPFVLIGQTVGTTLLIHVAEKYLLFVLGMFLIGYSGWRLLANPAEKPLARAWALPLGVVGGIFSALFGTGGVIFTVFLTRRIADKQVLRATNNLMVLLAAISRGLLLLSTGFFSRLQVWQLTVLLLPFVFVGLYAGNHLHSRASTQRVMQAIWLILIAAGANLIRQGSM